MIVFYALTTEIDTNVEVVLEKRFSVFLSDTNCVNFDVVFGEQFAITNQAVYQAVYTD
jgi:hypothetical protein